MGKIKVKKRTGIRVHLEGLAEATESVLRKRYPVNEDGRPKDLREEDVYAKSLISFKGLTFEYEHDGHRYKVEIRRHY